VWSARLDVPIAGAELMISNDERERAARLDVHNRRRFVAAHAFLRTVLGRRLGCDPAEVRFTQSPRGKPELADQGERVLFNLSHSGELAAVVVGESRSVGIDIEQADAKHGHAGFAQLAPRVLTGSELAQLDTFSSARERECALLRAWTRKEALLKARGSGLADDPAAIEVGADSGLAPRSIALAERDGSPSNWIVASFTPATGFVGAVAADDSRRLGLEVVSGVEGDRRSRWRQPLDGCREWDSHRRLSVRAALCGPSVGLGMDVVAESPRGMRRLSNRSC
jgi:4'-phosphopantetheinyl transferase